MSDLELTKDIIRIDTDEKSIRYSWDENAYKLDRNIQIVSIDEYHSMKESFPTKYSLPRYVNERTILIRHPFNNNKFISIDDFEEVVYKDKMYYISDIVRNLGCKKFDWHIEINEIQERLLDVDGKVKIKAVDIKSKYKRDEESRYSSLIKLTDTFSLSQSYNINDYNQAIEDAKKYNLYDEIDVYSVIKGRNPLENNLIGDRHLSITLSNDVNKLFDYTFSLNVLGGVFSLDAKVVETLKYQKTIKLELDLEFPKPEQ